MGRVLKRRQKWIRDLCPRYLQNNETCLHVLQCPVETSRTQWESAINELQRNTNRTTNESTNNHGLEITAARLARLTTISFSSIHTGDEGLLSSVEERFKQLDQFPHGTNE